MVGRDGRHVAEPLMHLICDDELARQQVGRLAGKRGLGSCSAARGHRTDSERGQSLAGGFYGVHLIRWAMSERRWNAGDAIGGGDKKWMKW